MKNKRTSIKVFTHAFFRCRSTSLRTSWMPPVTQFSAWLLKQEREVYNVECRNSRKAFWHFRSRTLRTYRLNNSKCPLCLLRASEWKKILKLRSLTCFLSTLSVKLQYLTLDLKKRALKVTSAFRNKTRKWLQSWPSQKFRKLCRGNFWLLANSVFNVQTMCA